MGKRFVEGKGWVIDEDVPAAAKAGSPNAKARMVNEKPQAGLTRADLEKIAGQLNLVVIEEEDLKKMVARIGELERFLDHAQTRLAELDGDAESGDGLPAALKGEADGKPLTKEDLKAAIAGAKDLDALTDLMKEVKDKTLLKLADERADELKGGGK